MQALKRFWLSILPGLFLIGFNIGTGSVTAMAKAGADYGMALLWTILLSCLVTYFMMLYYGRFTVVTGLTALQAFRKHIHPAVGIFFIVALTVNVSGGIMGVNGIITDVLEGWSLGFTTGGIDAVWWTLAIVLGVYALFFTGRTSTFEKVLALVVAVMGVAFLINFFLLMPEPKAIAGGLVPGLPDAGKLDKPSSAFIVIAGMVGTTVSSMVFLVRTTLVKEQGWQLKDLPLQRRDAAVSATAMFIISMSIMAAAAGTLHIAGASLNDAKEMLTLLEPVAGKYAVTLFVLGITAAGVSSQFPNVLLLPWLLCDYNNWKRDMRQPRFRLIVLGMSLLAFVVPVFRQKPVFVMILSQAFAALVLPATVACLFYITNRKDLMGPHANRWHHNLVLGGIMLFSLVMGGLGLRGFYDTLAGL